ncbi:Glutamyl-tRNA reductase [Streptomyces antimycoticus]
MSLLVVGLSHRSAPVSVLERAALVGDEQAKLVQDTLAAEPATEAAVLATCNRIELYADVDKFHAGVAELSTLLAQHTGVGLDELTPYLYVHYEDRAVHHLFSVACGLDSMVVGEGQILGQIKDALALGQELHTAGRLLNDLFQQALRVGKRAHSETGIDRAGQSLVTFGLEQLAQGAPVAEWARGKRALVIGAGSMSSLAAATLARAGVAELVIANRTLERALRLAESLVQQHAATPAAIPAEGDETLREPLVARAVPRDRVSAELPHADIVVSCTGATGLVLAAAELRTALAQRAACPPGAHARAARPAPLPSGAGARREERCPWTCPAVPSGFSVMGEAAVAGLDAAALEQHGAWVAGGTAVDRSARGRTDRSGGGRGADRRARRHRRAHRPDARAAPSGAGRRGAATRARAVPARSGDAARHRRGGAPDRGAAPGRHRVARRGGRRASRWPPMWTRCGPIVSDEVAAFGAAQRAAHITPDGGRAAYHGGGRRRRVRSPGSTGAFRIWTTSSASEITQTVRSGRRQAAARADRAGQAARERAPGGAGYADALREPLRPRSARRSPPSAVPTARSARPNRTNRREAGHERHPLTRRLRRRCAAASGHPPQRARHGPVRPGRGRWCGRRPGGPSNWSRSPRTATRRGSTSRRSVARASSSRRCARRC